MSATASEINVSNRAKEFAKEINQAALKADNEEELRIDMEAAIRRLAADLDMEVDPENERTVLSGRPDAVYGDLIIEYKNPKRSDGWVEEAFKGRNESDSGLIDYMYDIACERAHNEEEQEAILDKMVGVGTNGHKIFFCRYRPEERVESVSSGQTPLFGLSREDVEEGVKIIDVYDIEDGARTFLTFLRSLSRRPLTSEKLAEVYGPDGEIAQEAIQELYQQLTDSLGEHPRVSTLYNEWERVFGIVYGEEMGQISDDRQLFGNIYGLEDPEVRPLLFSVHTYYALLMKMLSTELLSTIRETPIEEAGLYEPDDDELRRKLSEMEDGKQYELAGLQDFFEEGFFGWYIDVWNPEMAEQIRGMAEELTGFEPATPTIKQEVVRDILKDLYQELVPRVIRHDLGEYLTPDWLAEVTIEETDFEGDGRILDPACGSGTFLVEAIDKIRSRSDNEGEELLEEIIDKVAGFDLNPISVIASRTNYLLSIGELAFYSSSVRIPVYQCDSVLTPAKYVDVRSMGNGSNGEGYRISTREGEFNIPAFKEQERIEDLLSLVNDYVEMGASAEEFLSVAEDEIDIGENWKPMVSELYNDIHQLEEEGRDGVWTQLLRNRLAPEFIDEFDYIIGNPPWVNWESLSEEYRETTKDLWEDYGLFTLSGTEARLGGGKKDITMLFTYVAMDQYLKDGGRLGFLITQSVFKSQKAGEGFRRFRLGDRDPLKVVSVSDMVDLQPFDASNRTSLLVLDKGEETKYPVPYTVWEKEKSGSISEEYALPEVLDRVSKVEQEAAPIQPDDAKSPWLTSEKGTIEPLRKAVGESEYQAYEGVNTGGANGVYWIDVLNRESNGTLHIQNRPDMGKKDIEQHEGKVEPDLIYPLYRGRDVGLFSSDYERYVILAQDPETRAGILETEMRTAYPKTYQFLSKFEEPLRERALFKRYYDTEEDPFYSMYNVGSYTVSPYLVVWRYVSKTFKSAVLNPVEDEYLDEKNVIADHRLMLVGLESEDEAHFVCALLNSVFSRTIVERYTVDTQISTHVLENIRVPEYDSEDPTHQKLSSLSKEAHNTDEAGMSGIMKDINLKAGEVWGIGEQEARRLQEILDE